MSQLQINTRQVEGVLILDLTGPITLGETSELLRTVVKSHVSDGERRIVIDLSKVTKIDSSGLGTLVGCFASLENGGGHLKLMKLPEKVLELMTITKLYTLFEIYASESDAVRSFGTAGESTAEPPDGDEAAAARQSSIL